jgi:endonuclease YncB( thermonuclease family)
MISVGLKRAKLRPNKWHRGLVGYLGFAILFTFTNWNFAATLSGKVVAVTSGDSITVQDQRKKQHKVRLAGISAPEKHQPFGNRSEQRLADLLYSKDVDVEWKKYDRYGRIVGKVTLADPKTCHLFQIKCPKTLDAGLDQIRAGLAWHYRDYKKDQSAEDRYEYSSTELHAQTSRIGLWSNRFPFPPWERTDQRSTAQIAQ